MYARNKLAVLRFEQTRRSASDVSRILREAGCERMTLRRLQAIEQGLVKPDAIDSISYGEYALTLSNPTFLVVLTATGSPGELAMELGIPLVLGIVDVLLGGGAGVQQEARELTPVEQSIAGSVLDVVLGELRTAWAGTADIAFKVRSIEFNSEYVQLATPESPVLSATFDVHLGAVAGVMSICYPFEMIQPVLAKVTARMSGRRERAARSDKDHGEMLNVLAPVPLQLRVELGRCSVLTSQLAHLKVGDVLVLDRRFDSSLDVYVDRKHGFQGEAGLRRGRMAVKLSARSRE
jgi:flagellar motor switch protein FliM